MKKLTFAILGSVLTVMGSLAADDDAIVDVQDVSAQPMPREEDGSIFHFSAKTDWVDKAKVKKRTFCKKNYVKFSESIAEATAVVYYNKKCKEGIILGLGYTHTELDWTKNLYFKRKNFDNATLAVTGFSERLCNWFWVAQVMANWDTRYNNFNHYTTYDLFLWGKYSFCRDINLHAGFYAQTGMKIDHIYPVLGFDWKINDRWTLNAVYPFNMSLDYTIGCNFHALLAIRLFNVRYRVGRDEEFSRALVEYNNRGIELAVQYDNKTFYANIHGGYATGGKFIISNKEHKCKKHFRFDASAYAGGEVSLKF